MISLINRCYGTGWGHSGSRRRRGEVFRSWFVLAAAGQLSLLQFSPDNLTIRSVTHLSRTIFRKKHCNCHRLYLHIKRAQSNLASHNTSKRPFELQFSLHKGPPEHPGKGLEPTKNKQIEALTIAIPYTSSPLQIFESPPLLAIYTVA